MYRFFAGHVFVGTEVERTAVAGVDYPPNSMFVETDTGNLWYLENTVWKQAASSGSGSADPITLKGGTGVAEDLVIMNDQNDVNIANIKRLNTDDLEFEAIQDFHIDGKEHVFISTNEQGDSPTSSHRIRFAASTAGEAFLNDLYFALGYYGGTPGTAADWAIKLYIDGGIVAGDVTDQGAGTVNVENDVYKGGAAYTNPDYVFELWIKGAIEKFANNPGADGYRLMSLDEVREFVKRNMHLPRVPEAKGIFERGDVSLEKLEEVYIHLFNLQDEINELRMLYESPFNFTRRCTHRARHILRRCRSAIGRYLKRRN